MEAKGRIVCPPNEEVDHVVLCYQMSGAGPKGGPAPAKVVKGIHETNVWWWCNKIVVCESQGSGRMRVEGVLAS